MDGSSTSSAVVLFCFTTVTFILHASSSLQTEIHATGHPTVPFSNPSVCSRVLHEEATRSESREGANGYRDRNGNGNGNENGGWGGNGVGSGNGDGNSDSDGDGALSGIGVEAREINYEESGDGAGTVRSWKRSGERQTGTRTDAVTEIRGEVETGTGKEVREDESFGIRHFST